jgi:glycosyltransferase involved in cell wall biosynthesis
MDRSLFLSFGGFDARYSPAYYEDTDLCMGIWQAGYRVLFQPLASIIHMEFGSSGRDRAVELQVQNREKFAAKWRHQLRYSPPASPMEVLLSRDHRRGRRLLMADDHVPDGGMGSGFPRARAMLDALVSLDYVVTFIPLTDSAAYEPATTELQQQGVEVLHSQADLRASLECRRGLYDAAIFSRPHNAKWMEIFRELNPTATIIYDAEAIYTFRDVLQHEVAEKPLTASEISRRLSEELRLMAPADVVMTVSEPERRAIHQHDPRIPVCVWGDSVKVREDPPDFDTRSDFLFVGCLSTPPNADALTYLLGELFPDIRSHLDAQLVVAGANPPNSVFQASSDLGGVLLTGFLPDLRPMYDRCRVFLAPHRFAAGAPHKVIEAMAAGIPCVVSQLLGDQLEITDGVEALIAWNAADFQAKAIRLHRDKDLWGRIQRTGLELMQKRYDAGQMQATLGRCIEEALIRHAGGTLPYHRVTHQDGPQPSATERQRVSASQPRRFVSRPAI